MIVLDLFCGAGGFSLGFKEGNKMIGVDLWEVAGKTWTHNIQGEFILKDVMDLDLSTIGKVDILIGSPECKPFSIANRFRTLDFTYIEKFLEIKKELNPKWWVMENVPLAGFHGRKLGLIKPRYLFAREFGLPHHRKRLFAGNYPEPRKRHYKGVMVPTAVGRDIKDGWEPKRHKKMWKEYLNTPLAKVRGYYPNLKTKSQDIKNLQEYFGTEERYPTPEMYAHIMGFPEDYKFFGGKYEIYEQIGNAVCPPISKAIWEAIKNRNIQPRIEDWAKMLERK